MARRKSTKQAPTWAVDNNPYSKYGFLYVDLMKSLKFQSMSKQAQLFYIVCLANYHDDVARASLKKHIRDDNLLAGRDEFTDVDYYLSNGYFVMPAKHMEEYGYKRSNGSKLLSELIEHGFIDKVENNKHRKKVNVYKFSTRWKSKKRSTTRKQINENVSCEETKNNNVSCGETKTRDLME